MELRRVPAGVDEHAHRCAQNFVRLLNGSKILAAVNNYAFSLDPDDGVSSCVPFHIVEGFYDRLVEPAADVATADIQFGHSRLNIDILLAAEASLRSDFDDSPCGVDEFVRRVEVEAARPERTAIVAYARHYVPLEPARRELDGILVSDIETIALIDSSGRLAPYADLARLVGPRSLRLVRLLSTPSQYSSATFRLVSAVCLLDGGIVMLAARLAIPGAPAVPVMLVIEAVAEVPVPRPVHPRCLAYRQRRFRRRFAMTTFASASVIWLRAFALPVELFKLPLSNHDVRLEVQVRHDCADDARHKHVVRFALPR
jgi:hypothetical protein